jgi:hypothetical protein
MNRKQRIAVGIGVVLGFAIAIGAAWWQQSGPNERQVRRVVVTTIQKETPESFLITGTLHITAEATVDSSSTLTPQWFNEIVAYASTDVGSAVASWASVRDRATVKVPGRVSYGFDVRRLRPEMIGVGSDGRIAVDLPPLSVRGTNVELGRLEVKTSKTGTWKRLFVSSPERIEDEVRTRALEKVQASFREQAEARIRTATQPRLNTARAVVSMLTPTLQAAGIDDPRFRIRVGEQLVLTPKADSLQTTGTDQPG